MQTLKIHIDGMTCGSCAERIESTLNALPGVTASVSYDSALAAIRHTADTTQDVLFDTIRQNGYTPTLLDGAQPHVAIIGTGSGAFAAAIKSVEGGARVTLIEAADNIGGTCVNVGCVPSKIMIRGAHVAHLQGHHGFNGVPMNTPAIDRKAMVEQQQHWVEGLRHAKYESILESHPDIQLVRGWASFSDANTLRIKQADGADKYLAADRFLIATGARAAIPGIPGLKETPYWTSTEALVAETLPDHLVVLGGSVVALELAQAFLHLGVKVTLMARSTLLSKDEPQIGEGLLEVLTDEGMRVLLHTVPTQISHNGGGFEIQLADETVRADRLLVATGRQPNTHSLGLSAIGVATEPDGAVIVDDKMQTSIPHVYAAGDCTSQPQYVYVAAAAGTRAATNMTGGNAALDLSILPTVVFTSPQVASVGLTEQQAQKQGFDTDSRTLSLDNVPRALANMDSRGFIKLVAARDTGRLLGCQVLADQAGEIIQSAAFALRAGMSTADLAGQLFPYLTLVEGLKLCAQTFSKDVKQLSCCAG